MNAANFIIIMKNKHSKIICMRRSASSPHSVSLTSAWQTGSLPSQGAVSISSYWSPSSRLLYTSPDKEPAEFTLPNYAQRHPAVTLFHFQCVPHLAVKVSQLFSQLRLCGFRQLVIQRAAHLLPAVLLIFHLHKDGGAKSDRIKLFWSGFGCF